MPFLPQDEEIKETTCSRVIFVCLLDIVLLKKNDPFARGKRRLFFY
ncbi:hypothetical protein KA405_00905 [Patescibacteria group bacterium]|nr:hypothetical protein [Patescibacteria group bacterium]